MTHTGKGFVTQEDLTQPFYVPIGKGRINLHTGIRGGYYLPALEIKETPYEPPIPPAHRLQDAVQQVKSQLIYLERKLNDYLKKKEPSNRYIYSNIIEDDDNT